MSKIVFSNFVVNRQTQRERKGRGGERKESEREAERQIDRQTKKVRIEKLDFLTINVV